MTVSLLNDEQMSNKVMVEHQPDRALEDEGNILNPSKNGSFEKKIDSFNLEERH